jgi:Tfp pilus assembly protein PilP
MMAKRGRAAAAAKVAALSFVCWAVLPAPGSLSAVEQANTAPAALAQAQPKSALPATPQYLNIITEKSETASATAEEMAKLRDPFQRPEVKLSEAGDRSLLERFPVDGFQLIGVITGPSRMRAMLLAPDGKTYFISEQARLGTRHGIVTKITTETIVVKEHTVNIFGKEEEVETVLKMLPKVNRGS